MLTYIPSNLGSSDGYKYIGEYSSIAELRTIVSLTNGQKVKLKCWDNTLTTSLIDVAYVCDITDVTSVDDGYRTIVTNSGQRLKAILPGAMDLRVAGLRSYGDNLGTSFNRVFNAELAKVIAAGTATRMASIKLPALTSYDDPTLTTYNAILNAPIVIPSFVPIECDGNYYCQYTGINDPAIKITNSISGVTPSLLPWRDMKSVKMFENSSGHFELIGPGAATASQSAGIQIGSASSGSSVLDLRGLTIADLQVRAFRYGLDFIWNDTYILKFNNLELTGNYWNVSCQTAGKVNSGENIRITETLIADSVSHQFYWNSPGIGLTLTGNSIDYSGGSVFYMDNGARGNTIDVTGGHIEGWGGQLIYQVAQGVAWYGIPNSINFTNVQIKAAGGTPGVWASRRKILGSGTVLPGLGTKVLFRDSPIYWPAPPSEPHIALMGYTDSTVLNMEATYVCPNSPYPDCLVSYRQSTNKGLYRFTGTVATSIKGGTDSTTGYTFTDNAPADPTLSVVYAAQDSDGFQNIIVNFSSESQWLEISNKGLYYILGRDTDINTGISVMMENIVSGTLTTNTRFRYFYGTSKTADGYEDGDNFNISELLTATYGGLTTPLTTSSYVGVQSMKKYNRQDSVHPTSAEYVQPGIVLRGIVGQIRIKLPVIWPTAGKGSCVVVS